MDMFFWTFIDFWRIFVMFVNVDVSEIVFTASESTIYEFCARLFLLSFNIKCYMLFGMHAYVWWRIRGEISRERGAISSVLFENWKKCSNSGKIHLLCKCTLCVLIFKDHFKSTSGRNSEILPQGAFFHVLYMNCLLKCPCSYSWLQTCLWCSLLSSLNRIGYYTVSRTCAICGMFCT